MLTVTPVAADPLEVDADVLVLPVFKGGIEGPGVGAVRAALGLDALPVTPSFRGDAGQVLRLAAPGSRCGSVMLVGLGRMDATDPAGLRHAAGAAVRAAGPARRMATTLPAVSASRAAIEAVAEGVLLAAYRYDGAKREAEPCPLEEVSVLVPSSLLGDAREAIARAEIAVRATAWAQDLVNAAPGTKRPPELAELVRQRLEGACGVAVHDERWLEARGCGAILGVGRGSSAPPRLVELSYRPPTPLGSVVLVGKGITFDSGGLDLKRGDSMRTMKSDMAGAAAIAGVMSALGDLGVRVEVTALLALAENMPGADAQRPGDVLRTYGGTTVEVRDTDAEGRLVLADALGIGAERNPDAMVDLATLTGSSIAAVGSLAGALMASDDALADALLGAAAAAGEPLWRLPLWPDLERWLDTPVADVNNTGDGPGAGAIMGGLFLQRFVGDVPWAHLDIAGPAFLDPPMAGGHLPAGATGYGVRTLLCWLERSSG